MIKSLDELNLKCFSLKEKKIINRAIFYKANLLEKNKKKIPNHYYISKTNINAIKQPELFKEFIDYINSTKLNFIIELKNAGISVKLKLNTIKKNVFSLRHPRIGENNEIYVCLLLNCIKEESDLLIHFNNNKIVKYENYYKINGLSLEQTINLLNIQVLKQMVILTKRYLNKFKSRNNVN